MNKRFDLDEDFYDEHRGKQSKNRGEWADDTLHEQTKRKRGSSRRANKLGRQCNLLKDGLADWSNYHNNRHQDIE